MEIFKLKIKIDINSGLKKCQEHLSNIQISLRHVYFALQKHDFNITDNMPTTSALPVVIEKPSCSIDEIQKDVYKWVQYNAFTDIITGLTECLKDNYRNLLIICKLNEIDLPITSDDIFKKVDKIVNDAERNGIPTLLKEIEKIISIDLPLKNEILSINKVRNCIIHRLGLVDEKYDNNNKNGSLELKWVTLEVQAMIDGEFTPMHLLKNGGLVTHFKQRLINKSKHFEHNEKVIINFDELNCLIFTVIVFAHNLQQQSLNYYNKAGQEINTKYGLNDDRE